MHTIIIEPTANPNVMKFVADYTLIPGSLELDRTTDISEIPLAQELFNYPFVSKVFISANFVAVETGVVSLAIRESKNIKLMGNLSVSLSKCFPV